MLGVCYYPEQWPEALWEDDAARMRALGLTYVRIAEFAWARMEPEPGRYDFDWLDRAVEILGKAGLKIVLGTPTATPPKWLVDRYPDILLVDQEGRRRRHGGRRHTDLSSADFWRESERIVTAMAERYGNNPHVAGWQVDNEFGCHDTAVSYSDAARDGFRRWLASRYGDIAALNAAWGAVFWSMTYRSYDEIEPPNLTVAEAAPAHQLDFRRYSSDRIAAYGAMQAKTLRRLSPGRFVTHNFMNFFFEFDPFAASEAYDFASWDSYPLGQTDMQPIDEEDKRAFARVGHPDVVSFGSDVYRGAGRGRFWIMEQQPGPVNWAAHNPAPLPGAVRLWTWQAHAHGAEVVSYFRWRQVPYAQEQMHAGLNRPDNELDIGGEETRQVARELERVELGEVQPSSVALVVDYESEWLFRVQPQVREFSYKMQAWRWYSAARGLGLDVDVVAPGADLSAYRLVLVPSLAILRPKTIASLRATDAVVLYGVRTGSKTEHFAIPESLPPGPLQELLPLKVVRVSSLRPDMPVPVSGEVEGAALIWREIVTSDLQPLARFDDGDGALFAKGRHHYLACVPDKALLGSVIERLARAAGLAPVALPPGLRLRRRGNLTFAFNFGPQPVNVAAQAGPGLPPGSRVLNPADVAAWNDTGYLL